MIAVTLLNFHRNNLSSLARAFVSLDANVRIEDDIPHKLISDGLILPGVGSFAHTMAELERAEAKQRLIDLIGNCRFVIGICLGMQLFATASEEHGTTEGLGFIPGRVVRFENSPTNKVPNIGWRCSQQTQQARLSLDVTGRFFYHIHSYFLKAEDPTTVYATSRHGDIEFPTVIGTGNIVGLQFHPEVSGNDGRIFLANLLRQMA